MSPRSGEVQSFQIIESELLSADNVIGEIRDRELSDEQAKARIVALLEKNLIDFETARTIAKRLGLE